MRNGQQYGIPIRQSISCLDFWFYFQNKRESKIFLECWMILHMFDIKEKNVVFQNEKADLISINV